MELKKVKLTQEEEDAVIRLMNTVWQEIGYDLIEAQGGKNLSGVDLRYCVLDQIRERMQHDNCNFRPDIKHVDWKDVVNKWDMLTFNQMMKIAKKAFPGRSYC